MNAAAIIRAARFGVRDTVRRIPSAFYAVDPFGASQPGEGERLLAELPEKRTEELVRESRPVLVDGTHRYVDGSLPICDVLPLLAILRDRQPKVVLEIGTFNGATTRLLALNAPDAVIHTLDLPPDYGSDSNGSPLPKDDFHLITARQVGQRVRDDEGISNVIQHYSDSATWDYSAAAGATFFFIDGSHTYEYVKNDTEKCLELCGQAPATLIWHDCNRDHVGVVRWLVELSHSGKAVNRIPGTNLAVLDLEPK